MRVREGPVQLATRLGIAPSTIHRVPTTARRNWLLYLDRATGEEVCRYEYPRRWRLAFCRPPRRGEEPHSYPSKPKSRWHNPYSCVAYAEIHGDETAFIAVTVLHRAVEWFGERGVTVELVLTENGGAYRSYLWRDTSRALSITPKWTRPYHRESQVLSVGDGRRVGLRKLLPQRAGTSRRTQGLAPSLQPATGLTIDQRARSVQLVHPHRARVRLEVVREVGEGERHFPPGGRLDEPAFE